MSRFMTVKKLFSYFYKIPMVAILIVSTGITKVQTIVNSWGKFIYQGFFIIKTDERFKPRLWKKRERQRQWKKKKRTSHVEKKFYCVNAHKKYITLNFVVYLWSLWSSMTKNLKSHGHNLLYIIPETIYYVCFYIIMSLGFCLQCRICNIKFHDFHTKYTIHIFSKPQGIIFNYNIQYVNSKIVLFYT